MTANEQAAGDAANRTTDPNKRLKIEVFKTPGGVVTVTTDRGDGGGSRLCGVKLPGSGSKKVAEFWLDERMVNAIVEDFHAED